MHIDYFLGNGDFQVKLSIQIIVQLNIKHMPALLRRLSNSQNKTVRIFEWWDFLCNQWMCAFCLLLPTCSSFKEYVDCSERVTRRTCGIETGLFIRDFLHRMADSLMQNFCEEHYKGTNQCPIEFSVATKRLSSAFLLILNVVCSLATLTVLRISWWEIVQRTWKSWPSGDGPWRITFANGMFIFSWTTR